MTVSRALRHDPYVSAAAIARVEKAARELNYRPDPGLGKLMSYLRSRRKPTFRANICALTDLPQSKQHRYLTDMVDGIRRRAESTGYACSVLRLPDVNLGSGQLQRMLLSRGVEGVLLLPMANAVTLDALLDWNRFSVVSATRSVQSPAFHQIIPDHYRNMLEVCERLASRGYERIGLVLQRHYTLRVDHAFNAAAAWHASLRGVAPVPPYIFSGESPHRLKQWYRGYRPDAIVTNTAANCRAFADVLGLKIPGPVAFATTNVFRPEPLISGLDERPRAIGAAAVDQLAGLVQRGERGVPPVSITTSIGGQWLDAQSCRLKRGGSRQARRVLVFND